MGGGGEWLREERRRVLGTCAAVCLGCGAARRWFPEFEAEVPRTCPSCGGEVLRRCPACATPLRSAFTVACDACGTTLRDPELRGMRIRRAGR